jgi:hypothetical protein
MEFNPVQASREARRSGTMAHRQANGKNCANEG